MKKMNKVLALTALTGTLVMSAYSVTSYAEENSIHVMEVLYEKYAFCEWFDANSHIRYSTVVLKCKYCMTQEEEERNYFEEHSYEWQNGRFVCECGDFYQ